MKRLYFFVCALCVGLASCGSSEPAVVESVVAYTRVGDINNVMIDAIEITVSNPRSIRGLKAENFDLINNIPDGFVDPATGKAPVPYEDDGIVLTRKKNTLLIEAKSFNYRGRRGQNREMQGWQLVCNTDPNLNVTTENVTDTRLAVLDDCIKGSFTYAGITREYILHLPKDAQGNVKKNVPLLVWQIGGGEYNRDLMTAAMANRCMVSLPDAGVECATLHRSTPSASSSSIVTTPCRWPSSTRLSPRVSSMEKNSSAPVHQVVAAVQCAS